MKMCGWVNRGWVWLSFKKNAKLGLLEEKVDPRKDSQRVSQSVDENKYGKGEEVGNWEEPGQGVCLERGVGKGR